MTSFIPRGLTDDELVRARAELHDHYQRRFGRVELRGFVEAGRDAPFTVEELFEPLEALELDESGAATPRAHPITGVTAGDGAAVSADAGVVRVLAPARPLLALLEQPTTRPALVLGAPGAGKSFFLRWCALVGSRDDRFLGVERAIPIHVSLAALRGATVPALADHAIEALLGAGLAIADAVAAEAAAGRVVFLLDGLDETGAAVPAVVEAIADLARAFPRARVLVTSRPSVLAVRDLGLDADRYQLEGLGDDAIAALLVRWCTLLERAAGPPIDAGAPRATRARGPRLARDVLASAGLHDLAATPLLLGYLAMLHHAGVALPDRRVELCERIVERLVARWNLEGPSRDVATDERSEASAISTADVLALLGPVALALVERGADGAVDEPTLRALLTLQLAAGPIAGVADDDAALALLRDGLGIVVERAPAVYGFVHRTLLDHLAAHELVRTGALEELIAGPACFTAGSHEVLRLALGVVGTLAADEARLDAAVRSLVDRAHDARATPTILVPDLLGAVLVDDPGLTPALATALCEELVPAWWFDGAPAIRDAYAGLALADRVMNGPWARELAAAIRRRYLAGWGEVRYGSGALRSRLTPMGLLRRLGCSVPLLLCEALVAEMVAAAGEGGTAEPRFTPLVQITDDDGAPRGSFVAFALNAAGVLPLLRRGAGGLFFAAIASDSEVGASWTIFDEAGTRMIGRRLDTPRDDAPIEMYGALHIAVAERPDPALLPNVLAAWHELAARRPDDGPRPPASVEEAMLRYGATVAN